MAKRTAIINTVGRDLKHYQNSVIKQIKEEIANTAKDLEIAATRDLTAGSSRPDLIEEFKGQGLNFININTKFSKNGLVAEVGPEGENEMAAYIEFGTGLSAKEILSNYPQWIKDIAWTFKKEKDGTLKGSPYLFNNYLRLLPEYQERLKAITKKQTKS